MWQLENLPLSPVCCVTREESIAIELNEVFKGVDMYDLMVKAGESIANHINSINKSNIAIVAGSGNNGGDGIVAANYLAKDHDVCLILLHPPKTEEAKRAFDAIDKDRLEILILNQNITIDEIKSRLHEAEVVVDALLGVGLKSEVRAPYSDIISEYTRLDGIYLCAVDLPSGMDCNTGNWHCDPFQPNVVVTMQHSKAGLDKLSDETEIIIADIGISPKSSYYVDKGHYLSYFPHRAKDSHKGQNGRIVVIGGSDVFTGAPVLAGMAALRSGVDTLRIAVPETIRDIVAGYSKDFIVLKVKGDKFTIKGYNRFMDLTMNRHDVVSIGMGISNHPEVVKFVLDFFKKVKEHIKIVLDADAIRAFKGQLDILKDSGAIITPHLAELRMMLNTKIPTDEAERVAFIQNTAKELGVVILLKGRVDIITNGYRTILNHTGHAGMTVGGTGDVLAGLVGGINCFIKDSLMATALAAYIAGKAGELAAEKYGNSLLASDVIEEIPRVMMQLESLRS